MDTNKAEKIALELMKKHGLIKSYWTFKFDNAKRRFGSCDDRPSRKLITLSRTLTELNEEEQVRDTILHEIAHALVGNIHGHDSVWKAKALEIGCDGKRCYSLAEVTTPKGSYVATCKNGHVRYKFKRPTRTLSCGKCSGTFDPTNVLVWKKA